MPSDQNASRMKRESSDSSVFIASELAFAVAFVGLIVLTWPSPPWKLLEFGGIAMMIVAPFAFFPFSKALFLAFDLLFRPMAEEDLAPPAADAPPRP